MLSAHHTPTQPDLRDVEEVFLLELLCFCAAGFATSECFNVNGLFFFFSPEPKT